MEYKNLDLDDETVKELEDMWDEQRSSFFSWWDKSTDSSPIAEHPLAALAYCLEAGVYPPPSVLLQIADVLGQHTFVNMAQVQIIQKDAALLGCVHATEQTQQSGFACIIQS